MTFLYQAFGWVLRQIFNFIGNYGISIILFTILFKIILLPLNIKQTHSMRDMAAVQPELEALKKKYKNNQEKLNQETMKLYKAYNIKPMAGCLPLLLQLPIIYGLFGALREPMSYVFSWEPAVTNAIEQTFLWLPNLKDADPYYILPILCAVFTFLMQWVTMKYQNNTQTETMNKVMLFGMPILIGFVAIKMPAGVALYWVVQNIFTLIQTAISFIKPVKKISVEESSRKLEEKKAQDAKDKKEKLKMQSEMRMKAMNPKAAAAAEKEKNKTKPKMKTASGKKVRTSITKIPQREEQADRKVVTKIPQRDE